MATKNIAIMEDVYELLLKHKKKDESFSEELRRLIPRKKSIMEFAGAWKDMPKEKFEGIKQEMKRLREDMNTDFIKRTENW